LRLWNFHESRLEADTLAGVQEDCGGGRRGTLLESKFSVEGYPVQLAQRAKQPDKIIFLEVMTAHVEPHRMLQGSAYRAA